jgi:SpoIID/LytB domain protein
MRAKLAFRFLCASLFMLSACLGPVSRYDVGNDPIVRVGLLQNLRELRLQTPEKFSLRHPKGRVIAHNLSGSRWLVLIKQIEPARVDYRLLAISTRDKDEARAMLDKVVDAGLLPTMIEERPDYSRLWVAQNATNIYKVVLRERFATREAALARQQEIADKVQTELWEAVRKPAAGVLELKNLETNQSYQLPSGFQIVSDRIEIPNVPIGSGFHWEGTESRAYRGRLEIFIDRFSKLTVVNILPIEEYVRGVVPSEMSYAFPAEALKAQAVAARNEIFAKVGTRHLEDNFDLCADTHCQVYSGITREQATTNQAVSATEGLVMKANGAIIEANYAGVCGGHTENNENVWSGASKSFLRGIFDGNGRPDLLGNSLQDENTLWRWVTTKPNVFCNTAQNEIPAAMEYTKKYFRWEVNYPRQELQELIRKRTGEDFGELKDLVPLERGASGRLVRLRIVGAKKTFEIGRELAIRQALAEKTLWSACIAIEKSGRDRNGLPAKFKILGAGWGHGVGMCQTGAAMMALRGQNFTQILQHYYTGVKLDKEY